MEIQFTMKDKIQRTYTQIAETISETFNNLKDSAKEKGQAFVDDWLNVLPELEAMGFETTSFGVSLAISPAVEVEMKGAGAAFTDERIEQLMETYDSNKYVSLVLKSISTAKKMHKKIGKSDRNVDIFLKIIISVPPEVQVYLGKPEIM